MAKCAKCGYLAQRVWRQGIPAGFREVDEDGRRTGVLPRSTTGTLTSVDTFACFARCTDLRGEVKDGDGAKALDVINRNRTCDFVEWIQGFTPKEHREMMDRKEWREWQERQRLSERRWRIIEVLIFIAAGAATAIIAALISRGWLF